MPEPLFITARALAARLGSPDMPTIIDIRLEEDIASDPVRIPTAMVCPWTGSDADLPRVSGRQSVVVCHRGLKLSQGAAALLRAEGQDGVVLTGGARGWIEAGFPTVPLETGRTLASRWCISMHPTLNEHVSAWIVRRFVDPDAQFLTVEPEQMKAVSERFGAEIPSTTPREMAEGLTLGRWLDAFLQAAQTLEPFLTGLARTQPEPTQRIEAAIDLIDLLYASEAQAA